MPVTAQTIIQDISRKENLYWSGAATSGSTTTVVTTAFSEYEDGFFVGMWIRITSGSSDGDERRITGFAQATGTFTVDRVFTAAITTNTFEIHGLLEPSKMLVALQHCRRRWFDKGMNSTIRDATLTTIPNRQSYIVPSTILRVTSVALEAVVSPDITENRLPNTSMETTTSLTATGGTIAAFPIPAYPYIIPKYGSGCIKADATLNTTFTINQTILLPATFSGIECSFSQWVYCKTASRVRLDIVDTTNTTSGATHQGLGWELLEVSATIVDSNLALTARVNCSSGASLTFFPSRGWYVIGDREPDHYPTTLPPWSWDVIRRTTPSENVLTFADDIPERRQILIEGEGFITNPATYTTSLDIDDLQYELLVHAGLATCLEMFGNGISRFGAEDVRAKQGFYQQYAENMQFSHGRPNRMVPIRMLI